jgi:hypothetical protein
VGKAEPRGDAGGDRHGPVDPRRDQAVHPLGAGELVERRLVLGRDDGPLVGEGEAGRARIAVAGDDEEPALASRAQEAELRRPGA